MSRDPHDYTIEVCIECGAQLGRSGNGRCPVSRRHWSRGGVVIPVVVRTGANTGLAPEDKTTSNRETR